MAMSSSLALCAAAASNRNGVASEHYRADVVSMAGLGGGGISRNCAREGNIIATREGNDDGRCYEMRTFCVYKCEISETAAIIIIAFQQRKKSFRKPAW